MNVVKTQKLSNEAERGIAAITRKLQTQGFHEGTRVTLKEMLAVLHDMNNRTKALEKAYSRG